MKVKIEREDLITYLNGLKNSVIHASTMMHQINTIFDWNKVDIRDEADTSGQFFGYVFLSFHRVLVLELYKLLWSTEYMNLNQFLNHLSRNYDLVRPKSLGVLVSDEVFQSNIRKQKIELRKIKPIISNIQELRNNLIAHSDQTYYDNAEKLGRDFPVSWQDLDNALEIVRNIVKQHYSYIHESDIDLEQIYSSNNIELYLKRSMGFRRFWENKNLRNLKKFVFLKEDYDPDNIYLNKPD